MRIAILGLGLIGGSMAAGLRQQGNRVVGYDQNAASLAKGLELEVIDDAASSVAEAVARADMVVLAVPVLAVEQVLSEIPGDFDGVLTDVGSVKQPIFDAFINVFGAVPEHFVAGHPIAGSEKHGVTAANPELFRQHRVLLTPLEDTHAGAIQQVQSLWQSLGAEVSTMSVEHHDRVLGQTSHLPHLLAFSLIDTLSSQGNSLEIFEYAAGGLRDFSRIAASDPTMWGDIFISNRSALLQILDEFSEDLAALRHTIEQGDREDLLARLERSKAARDHFTQVLLRRTKPEGEA
jgi:3-phosphoshikimate 1-carboxyvinyltransferase